MVRFLLALRYASIKREYFGGPMPTPERVSEVLGAHQVKVNSNFLIVFKLIFHILCHRC